MKAPIYHTLSYFLSISIFLVSHASAKKQEDAPLTKRGEELLETYTKELESLRADVKGALPELDEAKKTAFLDVRERWNGIPRITDDTSPTERKATEELIETTETAARNTAGALLTDLDTLLSSEALDSKLMKIAVINHTTPRGLA